MKPSERDARRRTLLLAMIGVGLGAPAILREASAQNLIPEAQGVRSLDGDVRVNGRRAAPGAPVRPGDTVTTGSNAYVTFVVGLDAFGITTAPQRLEQLVGRRAQERKRLAATTHRVGQAVRLGRAENEDHVRRRLLQRLQERVGRVGRQRMGLVEDVDAIATQHGLLIDAIANVADVIDATIRGCIKLEDIKRSAISNRETRLALETRRRRRTLRVLAIKRLAEDLRKRRLARATRPRKQIRMPHAVVINRIRQRLDNVALTHNMGKIQRAITTIKRGHGVSLPATRGREARGG